jgi:D-alanyl-D-alanine carboxypeptidase (penicillin-binding protein 5/6)
LAVAAAAPLLAEAPKPAVFGPPAAFDSPAAAAALASPPGIVSRSAVLLDIATGTALFEKDADAVIAPASLTKLMTMHLVEEAVAAGRASYGDFVDLPPETWAVNQGWGSSLMFLGPGQKVTLGELMLGLAVASGNDAAIAVAIHLSGSVPAFVAAMNHEAAAIGLKATRFVEPSGYSEKNLTTAREFAAFCRYYLQRHPDSLARFHSVRSFAYPQPANLPEAFRDKPGTVVQSNRNQLLDSVPGVDGLKTGFIVEAGYNIALTADRGGTRLLAVLLGAPGASAAEGGKVRGADGANLLEWGFANFRTIRPELVRLEPSRVWMGTADRVDLVPTAGLEFTAASDRALAVAWRIERTPGLKAPIAAGQTLGSLVFSDERGELSRVPLAAAADVAAGPWYKRAVDAVAIWFLELFGRSY